jgi:glycosyltransferase involved in cell wall biosynthesis
MESSSDNILVSVFCQTYNHAPYIRQCMEGFLMQKTSFPFEVLIHDDASTDETADIIREYEKEYPSIIKPIYQTENQYSKNVDIWGIYQYPRAQGKYIAICEGDDYWIDSFKLQKQVEHLETHTECGMVYTKVRYWNEQKKVFTRDFGKMVSYDSLLLDGNYVSTPSVCLRKSLLQKYVAAIHPEQQGWLMGDYPIWLFISYISSIYYIDNVTAIYRVLEESASHSLDVGKTVKFMASACDIRLFFCDNYPLRGCNVIDCSNRIRIQVAYEILITCIKERNMKSCGRIEKTLRQYRYILSLKQRLCVYVGLNSRSGRFLIRMWYRLQLYRFRPFLTNNFAKICRIDT